MSTNAELQSETESLAVLEEKFLGHLSAIKDLVPIVADVRDQCSAQVAKAEDMIGRIEGAVDRLEGKAEKPAKSRSKRATGEKTSNCTNKQELLELITEILRENSEVPVEDLKGLAAGKLRKRGLSLSMFANIFTKCLKEASLEEHKPGLFRLRVFETTTGKGANLENGSVIVRGEA
jgi:hypothetical protein